MHACTHASPRRAWRTRGDTLTIGAPCASHADVTTVRPWSRRRRSRLHPSLSRHRRRHHPQLGLTRALEGSLSDLPLISLIRSELPLPPPPPCPLLPSFHSLSEAAVERIPAALAPRTALPRSCGAVGRRWRTAAQPVAHAHACARPRRDHLGHAASTQEMASAQRHNHT